MIPSPCIGRCRLDPAARLCTGCARSGAEVAAWRDATPSDRVRIWADLPHRRAALGINLYRRDWTPEETLTFIDETLTSAQGSWTVGDWGASIRFAAEYDKSFPHVEGQGATLTGSTGPLAIRFTIDDRVRVLAVPADSGKGKPDPARERVILAVPKTRDFPEPATVLTSLGLDTNAIDPDDRTARLFDLGIGRPATRVGLRTRDDDVAAALDRRAGSPWLSLMADHGERLGRSARTTWVVETPLVRVEVRATAHRDLTGPLWLDPAALALDRSTPPDLDLPPAFAPCALFDPRPPIGWSGWVRRLAGRV